MDGHAEVTIETIPLTLVCRGARLVGLLHLPPAPKPRGIVIVPGAPQYRVGSHRQFVLLARDLAAAGYPVLRFDYRGMGDSDGDFTGFEEVDDDIKAAVDTLFERVPGLSEVVLWGLCDGASAAGFFAPREPRVGGLILVNPWVRSEVSLAQARVRHYYRERLLSGAFWRKLASGGVDLGAALRGLASSLRRALGGSAAQAAEAADSQPLPVRLDRALDDFRGRVLVILSGNDVTGQEFDTAILKARDMGAWSQRSEATVKRLERANHTYANHAWRGQVHAWMIDWLGAGS